MNRCQSWNICPLGDLAGHVECRKPECPKKTMADIGSPLLMDVNSGEVRQ
jgi:hypothetical protein